MHRGEGGGQECLTFAKLKYIFIGFKDQVTLLNLPLICRYSLKWVSLIIPASQNLLLYDERRNGHQVERILGKALQVFLLLFL